MLSTLSYLTDHLRSDLSQLRAEVGATNATVVRPTWQAHTHHFPATLWAYVMAGFARLDLYSRLWDGDATRVQTVRMRAFLACYLPRDPLADALAIQRPLRGLWLRKLGKEGHKAQPLRVSAVCRAVKAGRF